MKDTTFILHYRKDCDDREFNLKTILKYLNHIQQNNIILLNDDKNIDSFLFTIKEIYPHIKLFLCKNDNEFIKSFCFNFGSQIATTKVLCFYDVDVLVPFEQLKEAENLILSGKYDHVYPFNGVFVDVKKPIFRSFLENFDFKQLDCQVVGKELGYYNGGVNIISDFSPGGCNLISKDAFEKMGKYDENFIGWGFEDTDFRARSSKVNTQTYLTGDKYLYHLEHTTHCDTDRSKQPHYNNNYNYYLKNL